MENADLEELLELGDPFIELDAELKVLRVNAAQERISHTPRSVSVGRGLWEVWPHLKATELGGLLVRALERRETIHTELFHEPLGVWVQFRVAPTSRGGLCAFVHDVSELYASRAQRQLALDAAQLGSWRFDTGTGVTSFDARFAEIFGFDGNSWDKHHGLKLVHPDDRERVARMMVEAQMQLRPLGCEFRVRRANDGVERWVETYTVAQGQRDGSPVCLVGTAKDVTSRRRIEDELRVNEERLSLLVTHAPAAIAMFDRQMRYLAFSQRYVEDYQLNRDELLGRSHYEIFPEVPARWREAHARALLGEQLHAKEDSFLRADGRTQWLRWSLVPWRDEHRAIGGLILMSEDVTREHEQAAERQLVEAELRTTEARAMAALGALDAAQQRNRNAEEQLRQAQKMEAIGQLAGGVAHDFNNLLTVILSAARYLHEELRKDDPLREEAMEIQKAGERAADLTRQLLAFSRRQVLAPRVVTLNELLLGVQKLLRRLLGEHLKLDFRLAPNLPPVLIDPGQFEQIVINLAVNSRDAMPNGGTLSLSTDYVELDAAACAESPGAQPGPHVCLTVADTGSGMSPEVLARVFEPFFTTKERGRGTGLGLATVYGIVKQSHGSIRVHSEVAKGTTFRLCFPVAKDDDEPAPPPRRASSPTPVPLQRETVLVVEDEERVRVAVTNMLRRGGYRVLDAANGTSALDVAAACKEEIHLLLTDVVMPGESGPQVAKRVSAGRPSMRVLLMSGYTDEALLAGHAWELIHKPFSDAELLSRVRRVLGH